MNERRRMMGSSVKPLVVFKYGDSALTNGLFVDKGWQVVSRARINNGEIELRWDYDSRSGAALPGYIDISGIDFTKYKTLYIEARYYGNEGASKHFVGYGANTGYAASSYTAYRNLSGANEIYSFDISGLSGTGYYIKGSSNTTETDPKTYMVNIWLE